MCAFEEVGDNDSSNPNNDPEQNHTFNGVQLDMDNPTECFSESGLEVAELTKLRKHIATQSALLDLGESQVNDWTCSKRSLGTL